MFFARVKLLVIWIESADTNRAYPIASATVPSMRAKPAHTKSNIGTIIRCTNAILVCGLNPPACHIDLLITYEGAQPSALFLASKLTLSSGANGLQTRICKPIAPLSHGRARPPSPPLLLLLGYDKQFCAFLPPSTAPAQIRLICSHQNFYSFLLLYHIYML